MKSLFANRNIQLNPSIRTQLLSWLVIPLLLLLVVGSGLTYGLAIEIATDAYDKSLLDSVYSVFGCVQMRGDKVIVDLPPAALAILRDNMKDKVWYQVLDDKGNVLAG
ncbi:MAG TPA: sensor histidine kinase N-terminal domain-containing protein, partial [Chroococcales cyanobacterium]